MTQIVLKSVYKTYDNTVKVIQDVNLTIEDGEFCVFLGPSGCGKSTLLRMVAGLESISAGDLNIGGIRMNDVPAAKREVAMVFQNYALYPHMNLFENMAFGLRQAKVEKDEIDRRVNSAARVLQIDHLLDRLPKALSGGQRQRVAIGRAIVRQPKVFLFDEPLSNLDAALRVHMRAEIAKLHRENGNASSIYVTHDQTEAMALADKIVLLRAGADMLKYGSVAQIGSPMDLYHRPANLFVAGFLGSPKMNFIPVKVENIVGNDLKLAVQGENEQDVITLDYPYAKPDVGSYLTLGIRPEHLISGKTDGLAVLSRSVIQVEHFGEYSYVYLDGIDKNNPFIAKVIGHSEVQSLDTYTFSLPPEQCHLFDSNGFALE